MTNRRPYLGRVRSIPPRWWFYLWRSPTLLLLTASGVMAGGTVEALIRGEGIQAAGRFVIGMMFAGSAIIWGTVAEARIARRLRWTALQPWTKGTTHVSSHTYSGGPVSTTSPGTHVHVHFSGGKGYGRSWMLGPGVTMERQINELLQSIYVESPDLGKMLTEAAKRIRPTKEEFLKLLIQVGSGIGLRVPPMPLSKPHGVDVAGYAYGIRYFEPVQKIHMTAPRGKDLPRIITDPKSFGRIMKNRMERYQLHYTELQSIGIDDYSWVPGENVAVHKGDLSGWVDEVTGHKAPVPWCSCGFWAFWSPFSLHTVGHSRGFVTGIVRAWGDIVEASWGFRAEKAEIIGLLLPLGSYDLDELLLPIDSKQLRETANRYRVPVYAFKRNKQKLIEGREVRYGEFTAVYIPADVDPVPIPQLESWRPA